MATTPDIRTPETALPPWKTRNLYIENDLTTPNSIIDVKADEITIEDVLVETVSVEINKTLVGAGGIDVDPGSLFTDNFNRASGSSLGFNWDEAGEAGNEIANDTMAGIDSSIQLHLTGTTAAFGLQWGFVRWFQDMVGGGDHYAQLKFRSNGINVVQNGPAVRCQGNGDSGSAYAAIYYPNEGPAVIRLTKWNSQTFEADGTVLGSYTVTLVADDLVKVQATGSTIKVFVNGIERISVIDAAVTGGRPGAVLRGPSQAGTSTFTLWDDWQCGDGGGGTQLKWYAIWLIAKNDGTVAGLLSESFTAPMMPGGYNKKRRVGAIRTNVSTNFYRMLQIGDFVQYQSSEGEWVVTNAGPTTTFTAASAIAFMPTTARRALGFFLVFGVSATMNGLFTRPTGSGASGKRQIDFRQTLNLGVESWIETDTVQSFDWKHELSPGAGSSTYIGIRGYVDPVL